MTIFGSTRSRTWLLVTIGWTVVPFVLVVAVDWMRGVEPRLPTPSLLLFSLFFWWAWVPLTFLVLALGRRFPPLASIRHALLHLGVSLAVAMLIHPYLALVSALLPLGISPAEVLGRMFDPFGGLGALFQLIYWLVLAASRGWSRIDRARRRHAQLTEARLEALESQLQPHFLFNTLNTIATLMDEDVERARAMIVGLGDLLRASLESRATSQIPLAEELELVQLYLDIEASRFEDRLTIETDVADDTRNVLVPHLLLQPLVENAIRHGIGGSPDAGLLRIATRKHGGSIEIRIEDDGPGTNVPETGGPNTTNDDGHGIGLGNVRARLDELHGPAARLDLRPRQPRGTVVTVALPYRLAEHHLAETR